MRFAYRMPTSVRDVHNLPWTCTICLLMEHLPDDGHVSAMRRSCDCCGRIARPADCGRMFVGAYHRRPRVIIKVCPLILHYGTLLIPVAPGQDDKN